MQSPQRPQMYPNDSCSALLTQLPFRGFACSLSRCRWPGKTCIHVLVIFRLKIFRFWWIFLYLRRKGLYPICLFYWKIRLLIEFLAQKWSTFSTFGQRKNHNFLDSRYFFGSNLETPCCFCWSALQRWFFGHFFYKACTSLFLLFLALMTSYVEQ